MQLPGKRLASNVQTPKQDVIRKKKAVPDALSEVYVAPIFGHRLLEL
jgi:hypothetical protein